MPVVDLLAPEAGEVILDLGCGDGTLTRKMMDLGCTVVGVDASPEQIAKAREDGVDAHVMDGQALVFGDGEDRLPEDGFDAVFTNAALHWMKDPDAVIRGVRRALKPGGRFVGEFGGAGNVAMLRAALRTAVAMRGYDPDTLDPWYFPSADAYHDKLESHGFRVTSIGLIPRPTPLPGDVSGWLDTFGESFLNVLQEETRRHAVDEIRESLAPMLVDEEGVWHADYVRLRFAAVLDE